MPGPAQTTVFRFTCRQCSGRCSREIRGIREIREIGGYGYIMQKGNKWDQSNKDLVEWFEGWEWLKGIREIRR